MSDEMQKWIEAGKTLAANPDAKVKCPCCGTAFLSVQDVPAGHTKIERHLRCPTCGAYNAILMKRPEESES